MASRHVYTPILKGKLNDLKALARVSPDIRPMIKPLIAPPVPVKGQRLEDALQSFVGNVVKHYPVDHHGTICPGLSASKGEVFAFASMPINWKTRPMPLSKK